VLHTVVAFVIKKLHKVGFDPETHVPLYNQSINQYIYNAPWYSMILQDQHDLAVLIY